MKQDSSNKSDRRYPVYYRSVKIDSFDRKLIFVVMVQVDLRHVDEQENTNVVDRGVDLSEFYMSVEWDILEVPAVRWVILLLATTYSLTCFSGERKNQWESYRDGDVCVWS